MITCTQNFKYKCGEVKHIEKIYGNTSGLKRSERHGISRLYRRRIPRHEVITLELGRTLSQISYEINRKITLLVNRKGKVEAVFIGDAYEVPFGEILDRTRKAEHRLRGYRIIHTHTKNSSLSRPDLVTLVDERLDLMAVLEVKGGGTPGGFQVAHVLPPNPKGEMWNLLNYGDLGRLDINFEEFILDLEDELERSYAEFSGETGKEGVFLVGFSTVSRTESEDSIAELAELARSAGKTVLDQVIQIKKRPNPRYLIGKGKLKEIILKAKQMGADILIFDVELTPAQVKAISEETNLRVMDRTQLILEIFAQRARTSEGKIQVELASLRYTLPRLTGRGVEFSQLGGGIGTRGPGEQKIEEERRRIRDRISRLERDIEELGRRREHTRKRRTKAGIITVTLIGYTNVGKSTLFNTLTESGVIVEDKLFSTLNPTTRRLRLPGGREILLTDTVGFIKNLPEDLVKAFRATLEELGGSSLLIHLVDASDPLCEEHVEAVEEILKSTAFDHIPRFIVLNKIDKVPNEIVWKLKKIYSAPAVSALNGETFREFLERLDTEVDRALLKEREEDFISQIGEARESLQI